MEGSEYREKKVRSRWRIEEQKQTEKKLTYTVNNSMYRMRTVCYSYDSFGHVFFTLNLIFITVTITLAFICQKERHYSSSSSRRSDWKERERRKNKHETTFCNKKG